MFLYVMSLLSVMHHLAFCGDAPGRHSFPPDVLFPRICQCQQRCFFPYPPPFSRSSLVNADGASSLHLSCSRVSLFVPDKFALIPVSSASLPNSSLYCEVVGAMLAAPSYLRFFWSSPSACQSLSQHVRSRDLPLLQCLTKFRF